MVTLLRVDRALLAVVAIAVPLVLTGCAGGGETESPTSTTSAPSDAASGAPSADATPVPTPSATTPTAAPVLEELHQLYVASGLPCEWELQESVIQGGVETGVCRNSEVGIHVFASQADVEALLQLNADSIEPGIFLVGDRWVVSSEAPEDLMTAQTTMGGELWPADSDFFTTE
jgi:hypothetical protein